MNRFGQSEVQRIRKFARTLDGGRSGDDTVRSARNLFYRAILNKLFDSIDLDPYYEIIRNIEAFHHPCIYLFRPIDTQIDEDL